MARSHNTWWRRSLPTRVKPCRTRNPRAHRIDLLIWQEEEYLEQLREEGSVSYESLAQSLNQMWNTMLDLWEYQQVRRMLLKALPPRV